MKLFTLSAIFFVFIACNAAARSKNKMPNERIKLHHIPPSPPCRAVRMAARAVGVDLELIFTNIMAGDHMTTEFLKMNPQHTIPMINDNGFILWESRAIMAYFVNAYGKDDSLYPKNPKQRAIVDQRLNFDLGTLYNRFLNLYIPILFNGMPHDEEKESKLKESIGWFNAMIEGKNFAAGKNLTIADISLIVTFTNLEALDFDFSQYENVSKWFERTKKALEPFGYEEIDQAGGQIFSSFMKKN